MNRMLRRHPSHNISLLEIQYGQLQFCNKLFCCAFYVQKVACDWNEGKVRYFLHCPFAYLLVSLSSCLSMVYKHVQGKDGRNSDGCRVAHTLHCMAGHILQQYPARTRSLTPVQLSLWWKDKILLITIITTPFSEASHSTQDPPDKGWNIFST